MNKKKLILFITLGALAIGGTALTIFLVRRKKGKEIAKKDEELNKKALEEIQDKLSSQTKQSNVGDKITPQRDINKAIANNFRDIYGVKLYPAKKSSNPSEGQPNATGYTNVRSSAEVNTEKAWYDPIDNLLGKVSSGEEIGTIATEKYDELSPPIRWFLVKLKKPLTKHGWTHEYGWVRSDYTTFKPFKKGSKSSFEGNIIKKYDSSYQLGAEVFPHSYFDLEPISSVGGAYDLDDIIDG